MSRKITTYLPFGIRPIPRQLFASPMTTNLEDHIANRLHTRAGRMKHSIEADKETIDVLQLLPVLTDCLVSQDCLSDNTLSLVLEDPIFAAFVMISNFEYLADRLYSYVIDSPIACEIMCNYVRRKYPSNGKLLDRFAVGLTPEPHRMARLICAEHSNPTEQLENLGKTVMKDPLASPSHALFRMTHDSRILKPENLDIFKGILECIAQCPATLFEAIHFMKSKRVNPNEWAKSIEFQTDPRWIFHYLTNSMCPLDHLKGKLEGRLMGNPAWAVEYLDHQIMPVDQLDALFRLCHDNVKQAGLLRPLVWWYRTQFPEKRRKSRANVG